MPRTTSDAVIATLGNNYDINLVSNLTQMIVDAGGVVDELVIFNSAQATPKTLSVGLLEFLERYLTCHYYSLADQIFKYKQTGNAAASFQGDTGMGYKTSLYGQQAIARDPTGFLALESLKAEEAKDGGGRKVARMFWAGSETTVEE